MNKTRPLIAVIGSGTDPQASLSRPLGKWLAETGCDLINGGGEGVMAAAAQAFSEVKKRKGIVIGILPASKTCKTAEDRAAYAAPPGYPNPYNDLVIRTHLHLTGSLGKETASRNHIIVLSADLVVALPGSAGTKSEIQLAMEYGKPLILISPNDEWAEFATRAETVSTLQDALEKIRHRLSGFGAPA